jgi:hypothetical protein
MKKMLNEGNQIYNFISSSGSGIVINYGSGSDFLTSYGSGSGSTSQKKKKSYGSGSSSCFDRYSRIRIVIFESAILQGRRRCTLR